MTERTPHDLFGDVANCMWGEEGERQFRDVLASYPSPPAASARPILARITGIVDGKFDAQPALEAWVNA